MLDIGLELTEPRPSGSGKVNRDHRHVEFPLPDGRGSDRSLANKAVSSLFPQEEKGKIILTG